MAKQLAPWRIYLHRLLERMTRAELSELSGMTIQQIDAIVADTKNLSCFYLARIMAAVDQRTDGGMTIEEVRGLMTLMSQDPDFEIKRENNIRRGSERAARQKRTRSEHKGRGEKD